MSRKQELIRLVRAAIVWAMNDGERIMKEVFENVRNNEEQTIVDQEMKDIESRIMCLP